MLTTAVISAIAFVAVLAAVLVLYLWWRVKGLDDDVYRLTWDLGALAGSITMRDDYEAPERPDN
jgi:hypothetical protein